MLAITFLGTGTSMGVPVLLCDCAVCRSQDSRDQRYRSSIYLESPSASFLIDTGAEFRLQALRANLRRIDAVLYTHAHADHIMGFDDLRRHSSANGDRLPVYAAPETMENLSQIFHYAFSGEARFPGYVHPEPHLITGPFYLGENEIVPIRVEHGRAHVLGFLVRQQGRTLVAYLSDCKNVFAEGLAHLRDLEVLILGTPIKKSHPTHMNMVEGLAFARSIAPRVTYFTHLSHDFGHMATEQSLPSNVFLAYDGLRLEI